MYRAIVVSLCLAVTGCGLLGSEATSDSVVLRVDDNSYNPGDTVTLILENGSEYEIGYNLCTSTLERKEDGSWTTVNPDSDTVCTLELRMLPPGEQATYDKTLPSRIEGGEPLPDGTYRYSDRVSTRGAESMISVSTNPFSVR